MAGAITGKGLVLLGLHLAESWGGAGLGDHRALPAGLGFPVALSRSRAASLGKHLEQNRALDLLHIVVIVDLE